MNLKESSDRLVVVVKGFLKLLYMLIKQESITSHNLSACDFWHIAYSVFNKSKSAIPHLFNSADVFSSASDKAKFFAKNF